MSTTRPCLGPGFYGGLFGWTFERVSPSGAPAYVIAQLDGQDVAGLAEGTDPAWNTYVAVDDAEVAAAGAAGAAARSSDGRRRRPGRPCGGLLDPAGVPFRLWQAGARRAPS